MMINAQFKVLDEAEYMDDIIEERGKNIAQINNIMNDLKDMSSDFVIEVDRQGEKIDELGSNLDMAHDNSKEANKQLSQADRRHR